LQGDEEAAEKLEDFPEMHDKHAAGAEALVDSNGYVPGMNPRPTTRTRSSAAWKGRFFFRRLGWGLPNGDNGGYAFLHAHHAC
jgi:hypothetical protein